jgi:hypothetical protein
VGRDGTGMTNTRRLLTEAFALDDEARKQCATADARPTIYKTFETPTASGPAVATMSAEQQARWDSWLRSHLYQYFDTVGVDFVTAVIEDERKRTTREIKKLRAELAKLRAEIVLMRGNVSPIRGRNAA